MTSLSRNSRSRFSTAAVLALFAAVTVTGVTSLPLEASAEEGLRIGYISTPRLLTETKAGKEAGEQLKAKLASAQKQIQSEVEAFQKFKADLERRLVALGEAERKAEIEAGERRARDAQRRQEDLQLEVKKTEAEVMEKVNRHLRKVIEDYGKSAGFDIILDSSALVYVSPRADITDAVIQAADAAN